jgi:predicted nucleic acid-binding protein
MKQATIHGFDEDAPEIAYLDPSFLINVLVVDARYHAECVAFAHQMRRAETILVLSNLGLDEVWFVLLRLQAVREHGQRGWFEFLRDNPDRVQAYTQRLEEATAEILEIPNLLLVELTSAQTLEALGLMSRYGLLPRDALHAAAALHGGVRAVVTTDADFGRVGGLQVWTCNPAALASASD